MTSFGAVEDAAESDSPSSCSKEGIVNCELVDVPFINLVVVAALRWLFGVHEQKIGLECRFLVGGFIYFFVWRRFFLLYGACFWLK